MSETAGNGQLPVPRHRTVALINLVSQYVSLSLIFVQGLLLVPLYLRYIPTDLYGAWLATGNVLAWLELVDPGVSAVVQQQVAFLFGRRERIALGKTIGSGVALSIATALLPLPFVAVAGSLEGWVGYAGANAHQLATAFRIALASTTLSLASYTVAAVNVGLQQAVVTGGVSIAAGVVGIAATFAGLVGGLGLIALPVGLLARSAVTFLANGGWLLYWSRKHLRGLVRLDARLLRGLAQPIGVTALSRVGVVLATRMDAFVVARVLGPAAVVTLTLTGRALEIVRLATDRIGAALQPSVSALAGEARLGRAGSVVHTAASVIGGLSSIGVGCVVALNEPFMTLWVGQAHYGGLGLTSLLALATAVMTLVAVMGNFVFALGGVATNARVSFAEAGLRIPALLLFTWAVGLYGVPLAAIFASALASSRLLPIAMAALLGTEPRVERRVWSMALLKPGLAIAGGAAIAALVRSEAAGRTWTSFIALSGALGVAMGAAALAADPGLRAIARRWMAAAARGTGGE